MFLIDQKRGEHTPKDTVQYRIFISMYLLLNAIYRQQPEENLVVVLSDLNPYIWKDEMPADPATWDDICEFYEEVKSSSETEFDAAYYTCMKFLRQYEEEWDYPIPYAMEAFTREKYWEYYNNSEK